MIDLDAIYQATRVAPAGVNNVGKRLRLEHFLAVDRERRFLASIRGDLTDGDISLIMVTVDRFRAEHPPRRRTELLQ